MTTTPTIDIPTPRTEAFCATPRGLGTGYYQALDFARELERETIRLANEREDYAEELDEIRAELPDESPCKHEETGVSLLDDIRDALRQRDGLKATHDAVFGALHKAGFHTGTMLDKVEAAIMDSQTLATLRKEVEIIRDTAVAMVDANRVNPSSVLLIEGPERIKRAANTALAR